jgi:hypothetical protein
MIVSFFGDIHLLVKYNTSAGGWKAASHPMDICASDKCLMREQMLALCGTESFQRINKTVRFSLRYFLTILLSFDIIDFCY